MRRVKVSSTQFKLKPYNGFKEFEDDAIDMLDKAKGSDIVVFGEWFTLGLLTLLDKASHEYIIKLAQFEDDIIDLFAYEANKRKQIIVAGSTVERFDDKYYDTCFIFANNKVFKHRKTHLFPLERERWKLNEYDEIYAFDLGICKAGVNICYESQIPECSRALTLKGAEIIFCPSFTITEHGYNRIRYSCHARCIENQIIMILSSTVGDIGFVKGIGKSAILSPCDKPWSSDGIVAECKEGDDIVTAEFDLDDIYYTRDKGYARTYKDRLRRARLYKRWIYGV